MGFALHALQDARISGDSEAEHRSWKLFAMLPMMLLRRNAGEKRIPKDALYKRFDDFARGDWDFLIDDISHSIVVGGSRANICHVGGWLSNKYLSFLWLASKYLSFWWLACKYLSFW